MVWASTLVQQIKKPTSKPESLSSIPGTYMLDGENGLLQAVLWFSSHVLRTHINAYTRHITGQTIGVTAAGGGTWKHSSILYCKQGAAAYPNEIEIQKLDLQILK